MSEQALRHEGFRGLAEDGHSASTKEIFDAPWTSYQDGIDAIARYKQEVLANIPQTAVSCAIVERVANAGHFLTKEQLTLLKAAKAPLPALVRSARLIDDGVVLATRQEMAHLVVASKALDSARGFALQAIERCAAARTEAIYSDHHAEHSSEAVPSAEESEKEESFRSCDAFSAAESARVLMHAMALGKRWPELIEVHRAAQQAGVAPSTDAGILWMRALGAHGGRGSPLSSFKQLMRMGLRLTPGSFEAACAAAVAEKKHEEVPALLAAHEAEVPGLLRDHPEAAHALLGVFADSGDRTEALRLLERLGEAGTRLDVGHFERVATAAARSPSPRSALTVFDEAVRRGIAPSARLLEACLEAAAGEGSHHIALQALDAAVGQLPPPPEAPVAATEEGGIHSLLDGPAGGQARAPGVPFAVELSHDAWVLLLRACGQQIGTRDAGALPTAAPSSGKLAAADPERSLWAMLWLADSVHGRPPLGYGQSAASELAARGEGTSGQVRVLDGVEWRRWEAEQPQERPHEAMRDELDVAIANALCSCPNLRPAAVTDGMDDDDDVDDHGGGDEDGVELFPTSSSELDQRVEAVVQLHLGHENSAAVRKRLFDLLVAGVSAETATRELSSLSLRAWGRSVGALGFPEAGAAIVASALQEAHRRSHDTSFPSRAEMRLVDALRGIVDVGTARAEHAVLATAADIHSHALVRLWLCEAVAARGRAETVLKALEQARSVLEGCAETESFQGFPELVQAMQSLTLVGLRVAAAVGRADVVDGAMDLVEFCKPYGTSLLDSAIAEAGMAAHRDQRARLEDHTTSSDTEAASDNDDHDLYRSEHEDDDDLSDHEDDDEDLSPVRSGDGRQAVGLGGAMRVGPLLGEMTGAAAGDSGVEPAGPPGASAPPEAELDGTYLVDLGWTGASDAFMTACPVSAAMQRAEAVSATSKRVRLFDDSSAGLASQDHPAAVAKMLCDAELLASEAGAGEWAPAMRALCELSAEWTSRPRGRSGRQIEVGPLEDAEAHAVAAARSGASLEEHDSLPVSILASATMARAVLSQLAVADLRKLLKLRLVPHEGTRAQVGLKLLTDGYLPILPDTGFPTAASALLPREPPLPEGLVAQALEAAQRDDLLTLQVLSNACRGGWRLWHSNNPCPRILTDLSVMHKFDHLRAVEQALSIAELRTAMRGAVSDDEADALGVDSWPPSRQRHARTISIAAAELHAQHARADVLAALSGTDRR